MSPSASMRLIEPYSVPGPIRVCPPVRSSTSRMMPYPCRSSSARAPPMCTTHRRRLPPRPLLDLPHEAVPVPRLVRERQQYVQHSRGQRQKIPQSSLLLDHTVFLFLDSP